jgi:hypothetical protein
VLNDREQDIRPFVGFANDPFRPLVKPETSQQSVCFRQAAGFFGIVAFLLMLVFEALFYPREEHRTICIPDQFIQKLKHEAQKDLQDLPSSKEANPLFLSDNDVLFAWWAKVLTKIFNPRPAKPVLLGNIFTFRGAVDDILPPNSAYLGNAVSCAYETMSASKLFSDSLGCIALDLRQSLATNRSRKDIEGTISYICENHASIRKAIMRPTDALRLTWSSW